MACARWRRRAELLVQQVGGVELLFCQPSSIRAAMLASHKAGLLAQQIWAAHLRHKLCSAGPLAL